jgi:hypothetical protein
MNPILQKRSHSILLAAVIAIGFFVAPSLPGQEEGQATPLLTVEKIAVEPANPGPDTLCKLQVTLRNAGKEIAKLYNFWSTETSRTMPKDGKLNIEVSLVGAQWMKIETEEEVEVWKPLGPVDHLPVAGNLTLEMAKP